MEIDAVLDSHIWLWEEDLPDDVVLAIESALTLRNLEKEKALERGDDDAEDLPDFHELYDHESGWLIVPRGCASQLLEALEDDFGIHLSWDDRRCREKGFEGGNEIPARPYQQKVIDAVLDVEQGIVKAPTGAGKTVAALDIINKRGGNALVIVNTKEIAAQWMTRVDDWLGPDYPVSLIGDGSFEICDGVTVALQPTLWSRRDTLADEGFFDRFQTVCLDECHHATARTYNDIFNRFSAECRFGMSATPEKTGDFRLAENICGPVIVEVTEKDVESQIIKPEIIVVETDLGKVPPGGSPLDRGFKNLNYEGMLRKLSTDRERASLVAEVIMGRCLDHVNLILSKRMKHLELLYDAIVNAGYPEEDIFTIIGMNTRAERMAAVERSEEGQCIIFSTLADEALDAPRIDRVHLTWPTKNKDLVSQQIGRGRRKHPEKKDCIVYDYRDFQVQPFNNQYMERRHGLYNPKGWTVKKIRRIDI